jgi:hypothetical protein
LVCHPNIPSLAGQCSLTRRTSLHFRPTAQKLDSEKHAFSVLHGSGQKGRDL